MMMTAEHADYLRMPRNLPCQTISGGAYSKRGRVRSHSKRRMVHEQHRWLFRLGVEQRSNLVHPLPRDEIVHCGE